MHSGLYRVIRFSAFKVVDFNLDTVICKIELQSNAELLNILVDEDVLYVKYQIIKPNFEQRFECYKKVANSLQILLKDRCAKYFLNIWIYKKCFKLAFLFRKGFFNVYQME